MPNFGLCILKHICGKGWDDIWADQLKDSLSLDTGRWVRSIVLVGEIKELNQESGHCMVIFRDSVS